MFESVTAFLWYFQIVILIYFVIANGTYTLFTLLSLRDITKYASIVTRHNINTLLSGVFYKPLSIIVPAYNEEATIATSITSLLSLQYPEYEVIVVNDGSTDDTMAKLIETFKLVKIDRVTRLNLIHKPVREIYVSLNYPNLLILNKERGGKADALNAGINASTFPLFCSIDADSLLENEALLRAARLFVEDKRVIATGGIVRVLNGSRIENGAVTEILAPKKMIECFQAVEYIKGFLSGRTAWNYFGSLLIISGAFGIFRKDVVLAIKGYRETVGEDMDLVVRLHKHCREQKIPYKIMFVPDPICFTQVPSDMKSLLDQRNRWHRGLIDSLLYSKKMFLNPRYGAVGILGYLYFCLLEGLGPIVEFLGYVGFILFFLFGYINSDFALLFFVVAVLWGMWINIGSVLLDDILYKRYKQVKDLTKLCLYGFFEMLGYRQIITIERMLATFMFWRKSWGKAKRQKLRMNETHGHT
ncbi:MAG: glycosyltransferase family 2 protein [Nitrospiraceae bacterium]|nr:MAG: glycosyltransferase family 2 protein [Nitrospiraceae bacterium]